MKNPFRKLFWLISIAVEVVVAAIITVEMIVNGDSQWTILIPVNTLILISASKMFWCGYLG